MAGNGNGNGSYGAPGVPEAGATSFFNDSTDNLSLASQLSPSLNPAKARLGSIASFPGSIDLLDHHMDDHRRPSIASIATTASSTGSKASRGGFRKLQGFFGEEFPGRDSSEGSLATAAGVKERCSSYTQGRTGRDRNHSNATDHTREVSPTPSRPKTPVPAPDVVPFLYQEADVCTRAPSLWPLFPQVLTNWLGHCAIRRGSRSGDPSWSRPRTIYRQYSYTTASQDSIIWSVRPLHRTLIAYT